MKLDELIKKDADISRSLQIIDSDRRIKPFAAVFAHSGDSWFWLAGLVLIALLGNDEWQMRAVIMIFSLLVLAVFVLGLKFTIRRRRPEGDWGQIYRATDPHSFPSGHAARSFLFAVLILWLGPTWLAWIMVFWAPMVSIARVMMGVHYLSDVIAGVVIGILFGVLMIFTHPVYQPWLARLLAG